MAAFPNLNTNAIFGSTDAWVPGAIGFNSAIKYWQSLLKKNAAGGGLPQLATAAAQSPVGQAYQAQPYDPSPGAGIGAYGKLVEGEAGASAAGGQAQDQTQQAALQGATKTAGAYGDSLISHLQGTIAQNAMESQANSGVLGGLTNFMSGLFNSPFAKAGLGALLGPAGAAAGPFDLLSQAIPDFSASGMLGMSPEALMALGFGA